MSGQAPQTWPEIIVPEGIDPTRAVLQPTASQILEAPWAYVEPEGAAKFVRDVGLIVSEPGVEIVNVAQQAVVGAANLFGAGIEPVDFRPWATARLRQLSGQAGEMSFDDIYRLEAGGLQGAKDNLGFLGNALYHAGKLGGWVTGTFNPGKAAVSVFKQPWAIGGRSFAGLERLNRHILSKTLGQKSPQWLPKALALGEVEFVREGGREGEAQFLPEDWRRAEAGLMAAVMWPLYEVAGHLGRSAGARWLMGPASKEGTAVRSWIGQNVARLPEESTQGWLKRGVQSYVKAGMPGAGRLSLDKLGVDAIASVAEGVGFSTLDLEWWKDGLNAVFRNDLDALERWGVKTVGNVLGVFALKAGGAITDIPAWQRRQPSTADRKPSAADKKPSAEVGAERTPSGLRPDLGRLGWRTRETGRVQLGEESPYWFEMQGEKTVLSPRLRQALGIKEGKEPPVDRLLEILEDASLSNALIAKHALPGETVLVEGVKGVSRLRQGKEGSLYTYRFGEILERPVAPEGNWKPAKESPMRPPDRISPQQQGIVEDMARWRMEQTELPPQTKALADEVIRTLRTVSAEKDPAVAEALSVWPEVAQLIQADPVQGIRDAAHLLTTKAPEILAQEGQQRQLPASAKRPEASQQAQEKSVPVSASEAATLREAIAQGEPSRAAGDLAGKMAAVERGGKRAEVPLTTGEGRLLRTMSEQGEAVAGRVLERMGKAPSEQTQEQFIEGLEGTERARAGKEHKEAVLKALQAGEPVSPEVLKDYPGDLPPTEAFGGLLPGPVARAVESIAGAGKDVVAKIIELDTAPLIERVRNRGEPEKADRLRAVVRRFKEENRARVNNQWAEFAKKLRNRKIRRELSERVVDPSGKYAWTKWHLAMDEAAGKHFKFEPTRDLSPEARKVVEMGHDLFVEVGRILEESGARVRNIKDPKKDVSFKADPNRWRMVRRFTPQMMEASRQKSGPLYEAFVEMVADLNGIEVSAARKQANAILDRGLVSFDAAEFARVFELMPDAIKVGSSMVEILEAHPHAQTKTMMDHGTLRAAYGKEIGWEVKEMEGDSLPVPTPEFIRDANPDAQPALKDAIRALNGIPVDAPLQWLKPGTAVYDLYNAWRSYLNVWRGAKMTMSAVVNIPEISGAAPTFLGVGRVKRGIQEALSRAPEGVRLLEELAAEGYITREVVDWGLTRQGSERMVRGSEIVGQALTIPFRAVQEYMVELPMALAIREAVRDMQSGAARGSLPLRSMLTGMGFSRERAEAMLEGRGTTEEIGQFKVDAIHYLAGGTTGTRAEKSLVSQKNFWKNAIMFADFFRARVNQLRGISRQITDGLGEWRKTGKPEKVADGLLMLARYMTFGSISGGTGALLVGFVKNGGDGVAQILREWSEDPEEFLKTATVGSFAGGLGGIVLESFMERGEDESATDALLEAVPVYSAGKEAAEFIQGVLPDPPSTNPYAGMGPVEKMGAFIQRLAPLARNVHEGLFGLSAVAISEVDPELDAALDAYYGWWRKEIGFPARESDEARAKKSGKDVEDVRNFRTAMKQVSRLVKEGKRGGPEIRQAMMDAVRASNWESVARSLEVRRVFDQDFRKLSPEQRQSLLRTLSEDKVQILRRYDRVLELLADWARK